MPRIVETNESLEIQDRMLPLKRVILFLLSLIPLLAPYRLLIVPDWHDYLNPHFLFVAFVSFGALMVSGLFIWAAIAGLNSLMRFNKQHNTFTYIADAPVVPIRKYEYPIGSIRTVDIATHDWSDGPPSYSLKIEMEDGHQFTSGSSWSRTVIEEVKERVAFFLNQRIAGNT